MLLLTALLAGEGGLDWELLPDCWWGWSLRLSLAISASPVPAAVGSSESCQGHRGQYPEVRRGWFIAPIQHFLKAT